MTDKKNGREYLGYVLEKLKERITEISLSLVEGQKEIEGMHEYYWENYTEMDQYGYENYDNQQALLGEVNANNERLMKKQRLKKMIDSPYFGREDFLFEGRQLRDDLLRRVLLRQIVSRTVVENVAEENEPVGLLFFVNVDGFDAVVCP